AHADLRLRGKRVESEFGKKIGELVVTAKYASVDTGHEYVYLGASMFRSLFVERAVRLHFGDAFYRKLVTDATERPLRMGKQVSQHDEATYTYLKPGDEDKVLGDSYLFEVVEHEFARADT